MASQQHSQQDLRPVKVLELKPDGHWDSLLFKVKTGWILHFTVAPCLYAKNIRLYTDYPSPGTLYKRGVMRELQWNHCTRQPTWDPDRYAEIELETAGAFHFEYKSENSPEKDEGSGYFVVDPDLGYSPDSICCQTYISKLLGPLTEWKSRLQASKECGYNMIHFTPVQQLGSSRSAYSICNQLRLDSSYLPPNYTHSIKPISFVNREGECKQLKIDSGYVELRDLVRELKHDWGVLCIVDVIWNHTAFDTPWLIQHPEAGYNLVNSPHLRPAYALDVAIHQFSLEIAEGKWENVGIRPEIQSEGDIRNICGRLMDTVLPRCRLQEYFCVDVEAIVSEFRATVYRLNGGNHPKPEGKYLKVIQDKKYRRLGSGVDKDFTLELFNVDWDGLVCFEERIERCCSSLREELRQLNREIEDRVQCQLQRAIDNLAANMRYQFLETHGPRRRKVTAHDPIVSRYFCVVGGGKDLLWQEMESQRGEYVVAHNGWVMNADPLVNFAAEGSLVYFQRELIVWGDSIKLRYGEGPDDSPWLWEHMKNYTQVMAWIFDGFRLDNAHNTPVNVAEGLLDAAREVNPNLYVVAELFTSSEERDNYYVNRLGINSLIREAMHANRARELGRLVYKYGGVPVASFLPPPTSAVLKPTIAHAMFIDATHDNNPGHIQSRSVQDALPNTALVTIASCASGGCRGYDELVPHMMLARSHSYENVSGNERVPGTRLTEIGHEIDVVSETRLYTQWSATPTSKKKKTSMDVGILSAKAQLNALHHDLAEQGFNQIYVDQVTEEIVAVTRHSPSTHQSVILMAHTAFRPPEEWAEPTEERRNTQYVHVPPLTVPGIIQEIIMEARLVRRVPDTPPFEKDDYVTNGLQSHVLEMRSHISLMESHMCHLAPGNEGGNGAQTQEVVFNDFSPGSIIAFRVSLVPDACSAIQVIRTFLGGCKISPRGTQLLTDLKAACSALNLFDLNYALYRCDSEERDDGKGGGVYVVPGMEALVYCGLQGIMSLLAGVRDNNDLGHPICDNLRAGDWMIGYTVNRLKLRRGTAKLAEILSAVFDQVWILPRYLVPCYFEAITSLTYSLLVKSAISKMSGFVQKGSSFVKNLALGSVQLYSVSQSAKLPSSLSGTKPPTASMAAGLPHFSTGAMRCWGRDTFIALRGLLLTTGRFEDAWDSLVSFGACVRHGLIPNLLNGGTNPRYNCRDAPWWWLQGIQDFCRLAPKGYEILQADVRRIFRSDDAPAELNAMESSPLCEIIQEILQRHINGIEFRERNAGADLDRNMSLPGFNVRAGVDQETGFVFGGSLHNCGTWMDKMGESAWAGNKGAPATPRDGSAVELIGLCYSTVSWLAKLYKQGIYPYSGVKLPSDEHTKIPRQMTFSDWGKALKKSFETKFWIPQDRNVACEREGQEAGYIHRTGIFKDCLGATQRYSDYQLRPNFPIAMVVSPEIFSPPNAWQALVEVEKVLLGPLGMRTLDPADYVYNGYYINSVDSANYNTARGFNYHLGPEWLWVIGFFLRAKLQFARSSGQSVDDTVSFVHRVLSAHAQALVDSPWKGLPELTNKDGAYCPDSCSVQAWSIATLLDVLHDLQQFN